MTATAPDEADRLADDVAGLVRDVPDFPRPGVLFKDLTPVFGHGPTFARVVDAMAGYRPGSFDVVAGVEARGFLLGAAVAYATGTGVVPMRKAGKLPWSTQSASYDLEYGAATIEVHSDAFGAGQRVLLVDDLLATGGTLAAAVDLVRRSGARVTGMSVVLELAFLTGRDRLADLPIHSVLVV